MEETLFTPEIPRAYARNDVFCKIDPGVKMNEFFEQNFGLKGKRALVTGAGRGIGRNVAESLAAAGAEVCVHYNKSEAAAKEVVAGIEKRGGKAWCAGGD